MTNLEKEPVEQSINSCQEEKIESIPNEKVEVIYPAEISGPQEKGEKDREGLEKFIKETQSEILLRMLSGGEGGLGLEDVERHDKEFAPKKMAEIESDAQKWVKDMPAKLHKVAEDPNAYKEYVRFLRENGREEEIMNEKDYTSILQELQRVCEKKDPVAEQWLRDYYEAKRLKSLIGVRGKEDGKEGEPVDDPYREIESRLILAQEQLKKEGLNEDAENLTKTIARIQKDTSGGKDPSDILLWDKEVDLYPPEELNGALKWYDKIDRAMLKVPFIGRYMARDYREPIRNAGGTIIRADGSREKFFTFTRFKKPGEKTRTDALFGGDYHYVIEPCPGDEVVSWEPSDRGKEIIMKAVGGSVSSLPDARSMGDSKIEYWADEFFTDNVEFDVKKREDKETGQIYSNARLIITSTPHKRSQQ